MPDLASSRGRGRRGLGIWNFVFSWRGLVLGVHYHVAPFCWCIILAQCAVGNVMYMTFPRTPSGSFLNQGHSAE